MNEGVFISLVAAHIIGDFYLQSDRYCRHKKEKGLKSWFLYVHSVIIGAISWALIPIVDFWSYALLISCLHLVIDVIKIYSREGLRSFVMDQIAHLGVIAIVTYLFHTSQKLPVQLMNLSDLFSGPWLIIAILAGMKPVNILIKLVLEKYKVGETQACNEMKNAGALIGNLERLLTILFVVMGQYEAIGFIIAAKSLLRFKDTDTAKTEYVLAGTFLSFGIALLCGLLAKL